MFMTVLAHFLWIVSEFIHKTSLQPYFLSNFNGF